MTGAERSAVTLVAIDDDPRSLDLIKAALKQEQLEIVTAADACEGLEIVLRRRPQIVLLDLVMPKMGGMELLERIVQAAPETDVILVTGHYSTESAVEAIRKGAGDYLEKPLSIAVLRQRVGKLVEEARQRQGVLRMHELSHLRFRHLLRPHGHQVPQVRLLPGGEGGQAEGDLQVLYQPGVRLPSYTGGG